MKQSCEKHVSFSSSSEKERGAVIMELKEVGKEPITGIRTYHVFIDDEKIGKVLRVDAYGFCVCTGILENNGGLIEECDSPEKAARKLVHLHNSQQ